jgi:hypothetical protein
VLNGFPPKDVIDDIAARNGIGGQYKTTAYWFTGEKVICNPLNEWRA